MRLTADWPTALAAHHRSVEVFVAAARPPNTFDWSTRCSARNWPAAQAFGSEPSGGSGSFFARAGRSGAPLDASGSFSDRACR